MKLAVAFFLGLIVGMVVCRAIFKSAIREATMGAHRRVALQSLLSKEQGH